MNILRTKELQIPGRINVDTDKNEVEGKEKKQPRWKRYEYKGTPPSPRSGQSAVVGGNKMYIFGGRDGNTFKSDVFAFDLSMLFLYQIAIILYYYIIVYFLYYRSTINNSLIFIFNKTICSHLHMVRDSHNWS